MFTLTFSFAYGDQDDRGNKGERREKIENLHEAVENDDYDMLSAEAQEKISEEEFDEMVEKHDNREATRAAIEANDYDALPDDTKLTEEEFAEKVERHDAWEEHVENVQSAVENGNFEEFQEEAERYHALLAEWNVEHDTDHHDKWEDMTEEEQLEMMEQRFETLLTYYEENGEHMDMEEMRMDRKAKKRIDLLRNS